MSTSVWRRNLRIYLTVPVLMIDLYLEMNPSVVGALIVDSEKQRSCLITCSFDALFVFPIIHRQLMHLCKLCSKCYNYNESKEADSIKLFISCSLFPNLCLSVVSARKSSITFEFFVFQYMLGLSLTFCSHEPRWQLPSFRDIHS